MEAPDAHFKDRPQLASVYIGKFSQDREALKATSFKEFLDRHPDLLPPQILLGPACIEMVNLTEDVPDQGPPTQSEA